MMFFLLSAEQGTHFWLYIMLLFFIVPVLGLSIFVFIRILIKQGRKNSDEKRGVNYLPIFGGLDNIVNIKRKENLISIEVKSTDLIDLETLRSMNVGTTFSGNVIKCSSQDMAEKMERIKKKLA